MAKRKKLKVSSSGIKFFVSLSLIAALAVGLYQAGKYFLVNSDYFKIRGIIVDPSLQFIDKKELVSLIGQPIFSVNLDGLQEKLSRKYPQAAHLKIVKRYPDQVAIIAQKRLPLAQINIKNRNYMLDPEGILLPRDERLASGLPVILGWQTVPSKVSLGRVFPGEDIQIGLKIIKNLRTDSTLANYKLDKINVKNLSGISVYFFNAPMVILDSDNVEAKIKVLAMMLSGQNLDLNQIKYIDLRFKEPIINKK